jgi:hypothetical protein
MEGWKPQPLPETPPVWAQPAQPTQEAAPQPEIETAETIDVAGIMGDVQPETETAPPGEVFTAEIEGEATDKPIGKRRGRRPKDPLDEMLKKAEFGKLAVVCHTLMYRAINTPERPCPDLAPEEASMIEDGTTVFIRSLLASNPEAAKATPIIYFLISNLIPVINRTPPIIDATMPLWKQVGTWISDASKWIWAKLTGNETTTQSERPSAR